MTIPICLNSRTTDGETICRDRFRAWMEYFELH